MKTKTYILTFFIFLSGVVFGQKEFYDDNLDDDFLEFREKVLVEKLRLDIEPIKPTDTIQLIDTNIRVIENYKLKYVHIVPDTLLHKALMDMDRYTKFGTDFIVISLTGYPTRAIYYYEIIGKEDAKFLKANITKISVLTSDTITYTTEFIGYRSDASNNISLINELNVLGYFIRYNNYDETETFFFPNNIDNNIITLQCCAYCGKEYNDPRKSLYIKPAFSQIIRNDKGNILTISKCGVEEMFKKQEPYYHFKYNSSDKLSEIKTEEYLYKIEWL